MNSDTTQQTDKLQKHWRICLYGTLCILPVSVILNYYGLYTDKFYFFKIDNYILPVLVILHLIYLYAVHFKLRENEYPDAPLRNVEFGMYALLAIYLFKALDTFWILITSGQYSEVLIPGAFFPMGIFIILLQLSLVALTCYTFFIRKTLVGSFDIDFNENVDSLS